MKKYLLLIIISLISISSAETLFEVKDASNNKVLDVSTDGLRVMNMGDTLMVISSSEIKAVLDNSKGLSRSFSVTTSSSKGSENDLMRLTGDSTRFWISDTGSGFGVANQVASQKGVQTNLLEVGTGSTTMREGVDGEEYTNFSPENIFIGLNAGNSITDGKYNVFLGNSAGFNTLGGLYNQGVDRGFYNVFIGYETGFSNNWGQNNVFMGYKSGYSNQEGSWNVFIGDKSGMNSTGEQNTYIGNETGMSATNTYGNSFIGCRAGYSNYEGEQNTFVGKNSGYYNYNGSNNTFLGSNSGDSRSGGDSNTIIGANAGSFVNTSTSNNVFLGYASGHGNTGSGNVFLGNQSGSNSGNVSDKLFIDNTDTTTPLIAGDFSTNALTVNGTLTATGNLATNGTLTTGGNTAIGGTLTTASSATIGASFTANGNAIFNGALFRIANDPGTGSLPTTYVYQGGASSTSKSTAFAIKDALWVTGPVFAPDVYYRTTTYGKKAVYVDAMGQFCVISKEDDSTQDIENIESLKIENKELQKQLKLLEDRIKKLEEITVKSLNN